MNIFFGFQRGGRIKPGFVDFGGNKKGSGRLMSKTPCSPVGTTGFEPVTLCL